MIANHDCDRQSRDFQNMIVSDRRSWFGKMIVSDRRSRKKVSSLTLDFDCIYFEKSLLGNMVLLAIISISWVTGSLKYDTSEFPSITAVVKRSPPSFPKSMLDTVLLSVNNLYEKTSRKGPSKIKWSKLKKNYLEICLILNS